jgi:hypothetical protein
MHKQEMSEPFGACPIEAHTEQILIQTETRLLVQFERSFNFNWNVVRQ